MSATDQEKLDARQAMSLAFLKLFEDKSDYGMDGLDEASQKRRMADVFADTALAALSATLPEDVAGVVERLQKPGTWARHDEDLIASSATESLVRDDAPFEAASLLTAQAAELAAVKRERDNLQAALTARAKTMLRLRDTLVQVHDHIEDEGDRVYFGSSNDADILKEVWHDLDGWNWDDIMADGKLPDVYEASRKAHEKLRLAEAALAEKDKALEPFAQEFDRLEKNHEGFEALFTDETAYMAGRLNIGHLRAARKAMGGPDNG
ncbi:MAG: hypothetical protein K5872_21985 [Rhizobiaceae bacterium]|nr:hypothetical protein [Rhizobiaceae bacterium]MCV0408890.1 hypothetical protein [Rhizobiaceae bacterium]